MHYPFGLLSMTELRNAPGEVLDRVTRGESFVIERNGRRAACLVPLSVFFPDIPPTRIADEIKELEDRGEEQRISITEDREMAFRFPFKLADGSHIDLTVMLPHGYPNACPRVYAEPIREDAPHRWKDGALCMYGVMSGWNPGKHTIHSTLELAREWLRHYDEWQKTGNWPKQEGTSE